MQSEGTTTTAEVSSGVAAAAEANVATTATISTGLKAVNLRVEINPALNLPIKPASVIITNASVTKASSV